MNMQAVKTESVAAIPLATTGEVLRLPPQKASYLTTKLVPAAKAIGAKLAPPIVMITLLLVVWQILCSKQGATLPSPSKIWTEAHDLIVDPFFVAGPQDIGLGWRVLVSLQRVAIGYSFASVIGILLGALIGQWSGQCAGSTRSSRCCARSRRSPGCRFRSRRSATASRPRSS